MKSKFINNMIISKKPYTKPEVIRIFLDKSITLMMQSHPIPPPPRRSGGKGIDKKGLDEPAFKSPFGDKPFS